MAAYIPIAGFTKSYNISVASAIYLQQLVPKIHREIKEWQLTENEKEELSRVLLNLLLHHARGNYNCDGI